MCRVVTSFSHLYRSDLRDDDRRRVQEHVLDATSSTIRTLSIQHVGTTRQTWPPRCDRMVHTRRCAEDDTSCHRCGTGGHTHIMQYVEDMYGDIHTFLSKDVPSAAQGGHMSLVLFVFETSRTLSSL